MIPDGRWRRSSPCCTCGLRHDTEQTQLDSNAQVIVLFLVIGIPAGVVMATYQPAVVRPDGLIEGDSSFVVLEPDKWVGHQFPLIPYIDDGERFNTGNWLVVLYHHDCPKCREVMTRYEPLSGKLGPVAFVEFPPYGDIPPASSGCEAFRVDNIRDWFVQTPFELLLKDGAVQSASTSWTGCVSRPRGRTTSQHVSARHRLQFGLVTQRRSPPQE